MEMNVHRIGLVIVTFFLYGTLIAGLSLLLRERMILLHNRFKSRRRLRSRRTEGLMESRLEGHLRKLLMATTDKRISPKGFMLASSTLFMLVWATGYRNIAPLGIFLSSGILALLPYIMLRIRLETIRRKSSFEGETLISNFLCQYRIRHFNIYETIEGILQEANELKSTRKLLFRLLIAIRNTGDETAISEATKCFSFAINTNWSRMLANCIKTAALRGINISLALEDILIQLREARTLSEERKRLNSEAVRMTIFMVPIMYIATIIMSIKYLEITPAEFIANQFYTREGFAFFLCTLFLFLINLMLIEIIQNKRFDY